MGLVVHDVRRSALSIVVLVLTFEMWAPHFGANH